jgi:hypothetical protein
MVGCRFVFPLGFARLDDQDQEDQIQLQQNTQQPRRSGGGE